MTLFLLAIILRVINLQYVQGDAYRELATELTVRQDTIYANKGNVYAADGNLLATSMSKFNIFMDLVTVKNIIFEENIVSLSNELSKMLGNSSSYYQKKLRTAKNNLRAEIQQQTYIYKELKKVETKQKEINLNL